MISVLSIWGILGYRVVKTVSPNKAQPGNQKDYTTFNGPKMIQRDTFQIVANYRDPFLGTIPVSQAIKKKVVPKRIEANSPEKKIEYTGFVSDNASKERIFFVTIDGHQHMMGPNESVLGVKLLNGEQGSIKVQYGNTTRTITLTE